MDTQVDTWVDVRLRTSARTVWQTRSVRYLPDRGRSGGPVTKQTLPEEDLLRRITVDPKIFGGKPIIRGRRLAVEHVLGMLAAGDTANTILEGYPWLEAEDVQACLVYARRLVGHERVDPALGGSAA
jgi:uncharacterized protein (DUF433 family)